MGNKASFDAAQIRQMLRNRYGGNDYAIAFEVPNGTGLSKNRSCDAMAMSLWPSKGLHLHGFEIKVTRSDWQTEMQSPEKSAAFAKHCHYWWLVAPNDVAKLEEIPADWGWLATTNNGNLRVKKAGTLRTPDAPDWALFAGLFRALSKQSPEANSINAAHHSGYRKGYADAEKRVKSNQSTDNEIIERERDRYRKTIKEFEDASGVKIDAWSGRKDGEAFKLAQQIRQRRWAFQRGKSVTPDSLRDLAAAIEAYQASVAELCNANT